MKRSRLNRRLEKQTKRNLILSLFGIVVILFLLVKLGIPALANLGLFISGFKSSNQLKTDNSSFIESPILDPLPTATNSAQIVISGKGIKKSRIEFFVNNNLKDTVDIDENGNFRFNYDLANGDNAIKTRTFRDNKTSDFSPISVVSFKNSAPSLTIDSPSDGQKFSKDQNDISVTGKTDPSVSVTVNGFWAIVDENNVYTYTLPLKDGDNDIKVIAIDQAGNKTEKDIKVNYSN